MNKLVVHHTYAHGMTFDVSNNFNHGIPIDVTPGSGNFAHTYEFQAGGSRINVEPSTTLSNLGAIRAVVRFFHMPTGTQRRHNLIEGHLSFALFINPNGSLQGTILAADDQWRGAVSAQGIVTPNEWHQAELLHDGVSRCQLRLDGTIVADAYDVRGRVRSVGNYGLAVGHWPDPPAAYTFEGYIDEVQLWKYDPAVDLRRFLDPCCLDRANLFAGARQLLNGDEDRQRLDQQVEALLGLAAEIGAALRNDEPAESASYQRNAVEAVAALRRRDRVALLAVLTRVRARANRALTRQQRQDFDRRFRQILAEVPLEQRELSMLIRWLCLDHANIPARQRAPRDDR